VWTLETNTEIKSVAFTRDGAMLAAGGSDGTVRVWTVAVGLRPVDKGTLKGHLNVVSSVAWNHDGSLLASGSLRVPSSWPSGVQRRSVPSQLPEASSEPSCAPWRAEGCAELGREAL